MKLPLLVDFYACEGGSAWGYHHAGFDVIGIDHKPQPKYPFPLIVCDGTTFPERLLEAAAALHGSPPCQKFTDLNNDKSRHLNLIPATRELFVKTGLPYVIENVRRAAEHLINPVSLTGTMFDCHLTTSKGQRFDLSRERLFETNWPLVPAWDPGAQHPIANVFGGHLRARGGEYRTGGSTGKTVDFPGEDRPARARQLMGMDWASMKGMSEAVPPIFAEHIGLQLMAHITRERIAA